MLCFSHLHQNTNNTHRIDTMHEFHSFEISYLNFTALLHASIYIFFSYDAYFPLYNKSINVEQ